MADRRSAVMGDQRRDGTFDQKQYRSVAVWIPASVAVSFIGYRAGRCHSGQSQAGVDRWRIPAGARSNVDWDIASLGHLAEERRITGWQRRRLRPSERLIKRCMSATHVRHARRPGQQPIHRSHSSKVFQSVASVRPAHHLAHRDDKLRLQQIYRPPSTPAMSAYLHEFAAARSRRR